MPADSSASARSFDAAFGCTRWSLVVALRDESADRRSPLAELTQSYSYPVYAYLRRRGHPPDEAAGLLLGFFDRLGDELAGADPAAFGRFRAFLFDRLLAFMEHPQPAAAAAVAAARPIDFVGLERRLRDEHAEAAAPEAVFTRSFALQVLSRGREQLREEARRSEREAMFELLERFLTRDPPPDTVSELARQLDIGSLAVQMAIRRLRQRFRQLVEAELQETVASPADLEAERAVLHRILAGPS